MSDTTTTPPPLRSIPGIDEPTALVLAAVLKLAAEAGEANLPIRHNELLRRTGLSTRTIDESLRWLRKHSLVVRTRKHTDSTPAEYRIRFDRIRAAIGGAR